MKQSMVIVSMLAFRSKQVLNYTCLNTEDKTKTTFQQVYGTLSH